jgi:uncharacterized lipoprotein YddW (UPF0748 family)
MEECFFMKYMYIPVVLFVFVLSFSCFADIYVVDNDDGAPAFQTHGTWKSSSYSGYNGLTYLYTHEPDYYPELYQDVYATWTPEIVNPGIYDVSVFFRRGTNRTTRAPFTVKCADGVFYVDVDMSGSADLTEVRLGTFRFDAGTSGSVRIDNSGDPGVYIADAVIFNEKGDNPPVISSISRNPFRPQPGEPVIVIADISDDSSVSSATLFYTSTPGGDSGILIMYDDGSHGDGSAGDGSFGAEIPPQPLDDTVQYFVSAIDDAGQKSSSSMFLYTVGEKASPEYRSIWVDSWNVSFLNMSQADDLIQSCRDANINTVMVEIRKIGDAYYNSNLEPRATNISGGSSFDPLQYLIDIAHDTSGGKEYVHVHGWFVMQRITRGETLDPQHILSRHPEYVMLNSTGSSGGSKKFLDPGHPGAVDHNVAVIVDCLFNYDIDGINLDYIRYPEDSGDWGYNAISIDRFNAFYGKSGPPAMSDPDWSDWRRECVTAQVKKIFVKSNMVDSDVIITADTVNWGHCPDDFKNSSAYAAVYQDWVGWLDKGIIDYNASMNYSRTLDSFKKWTDFSLASDDKRGSIIGMGAFLQTSVQDSMDQLIYARNKGADGINIYDWGSEVNEAPESRTTFYNELKKQVFTEWVNPPVSEWKVNPKTGIIEGLVSDDGAPVDHAHLVIDDITTATNYSDGSGWYAAFDISPGSHKLIFSAPGYEDIITYASIPAPGDIITVNVDFASTSPTPVMKADFHATPILTLVNTDVNFFDTSKGEPDSWDWDFGDMKVSDLQNPVHVYDLPGTYTVTLSVSGPYGSDIAIREKYIKIQRKTATAIVMLY